MIIKWVCGDCGSNNLIERSLLMQCEVCGKLRTTEELLEVNVEIICTTEMEGGKIRLSKNRESYIQMIDILFSAYNAIISFVCKGAIVCAVIGFGVYLYISKISLVELFTHIRINASLLMTPEQYYTPFQKYCMLAKAYYVEFATSKLLNNQHVFFILIASYIHNIGIIKEMHIIYNENLYMNIPCCFSLGCLPFWNNWITALNIIYNNIQKFLQMTFINLQMFWNQAINDVLNLKEQFINKVRDML